MSIPLAVDGETDLDSTFFNQIIQNVNTVPLGSITGALGAYEPLVDVIGATSPSGVLTIAANDTPAYWKSFAKYVCDGADDQVQWQAANDEATAIRSETSSDAGMIYLDILPGTYFFSDTFEWGNCHIRAPFPNHGVRIVWTTVGGTCIRRPAATAQNAYCSLSGVNFRPLGMSGDNAPLTEPDIWIDLSEDGVDLFCDLHHLQFGFGKVHIKTGEWYNAYFHHMRFDHWGDYAIVMAPAAANAGGSFLLDGFTADFDRKENDGTQAQTNGFIHIDNQYNRPAGSFAIRGARYEINSAMKSGGPRSFVTLTSSGYQRGFGLHISDIYYAVAAGLRSDGYNDDCILYQQGSSPVGQIGRLDNWMGFVPNIFAGSWPTNWPQPTVQVTTTTSRIPGMRWGGDAIFVEQYQQYHMDTATDVIWSSRVANGADLSYSVLANGKQQWGDGANPVDTVLYRSAANALKTDDGFELPGTYDLPLRLGAYRLWVNPGDGKLYIKASAPSSAADGTVVGAQS